MLKAEISFIEKRSRYRPQLALQPTIQRTKAILLLLVDLFSSRPRCPFHLKSTELESLWMLEVVPCTFGRAVCENGTRLSQYFSQSRRNSARIHVCAFPFSKWPQPCYYFGARSRNALPHNAVRN